MPRSSTTRNACHRLLWSWGNYCHGRKFNGK